WMRRVYSVAFAVWLLRPPRTRSSTLFPYTTLFRSIVGAQQVAVQQQGGRAVQVDHGGVVQQGHAAARGVGIAQQEIAVAADEVRSEEHTSELQSRENLVCRLLLEKKNRWSERLLHL